MAVDQSPVPERKGGIPLWIILAGGAAVALFLWYRSRTAAASTTSPTTGIATDPNTGLPVDPLTGLPYVTNNGNPQTIDQWTASAFAALKSLGVSPALAQQALYDFTNSLPLNDQEAGAITKALGQAGMPPIPLPFLGTVPTAPSTSVVAPPTGTTPSGTAADVARLEQTAINTINTQLSRVGMIGTPASGSSSIQYQIDVINNRLAHSQSGRVVGPAAPRTDSISYQLAVINNRLAHSVLTAPASRPTTDPLRAALGRPLTPAETRYIAAIGKR